MENSEKSENSENSENSKKSENSDNSENFENPGSSLPKLGAWPASDEFNSIWEHTLVVEQQAQEKESESSEDEEMPSQERNVWPALFGDTTSIWKAVKKKESNEEKKLENSKKNVFIFRILAGLSPTEVKASTDIFEGDDDDDIFA
ncbi:Hypothetical predicted protein [Paramuricea clavata]|uniref:Uncharacterized protein n=1 Tax=Paramuricea clavata TaxID=317549 RepID=A0A6S7HKM3_PARCT|nr:Hypothetical predicted protein [Paramuricea clavata]